MIKSGNRVYVSGIAATPTVLLQQLAQRPDVADIEVVHMLAMLGKDDPFSLPEASGRFRHNALFIGPSVRPAVNMGQADYIPVFMHQMPKLFAEDIMPLDVTILQATPPDEHGYMNLGVGVVISRAAAEAAKLVIVQVNHNMPRVLGDAFIHVSEVDCIVEHDTELPELPTTVPSELESRIAEHIAELIPDGATLQLGIGGIPDAVLKCLQGQRDLGIHTEMVSDGVMKAIQSGLITGARKSLHPNKVVATFVLGSKELYQFVDNNPAFKFRPAAYTNDPFVIAQNNDMVAINSAVEVDLTGQVCADSMGTTIFSGFGGQVDFMRGANRALGGKAIIALPSTARGGKVSRITNFLQEGAGVVTSRADVNYVVTEYGVARLFGRNVRQRAAALIEIAHPDFREELTKAAWERHLLPRLHPVGSAAS